MAHTTFHQAQRSLDTLPLSLVLISSPFSHSPRETPSPIHREKHLAPPMSNLRSLIPLQQVSLVRGRDIGYLHGHALLHLREGV